MLTQFIIYHIPPNRDFFHLHDLNHDGFLDNMELSRIYDDGKGEKDQSMVKSLVNMVIQDLDSDQDGLISFDEYLGAVDRRSTENSDTHNTGNLNIPLKYQAPL